MADRVRIAVVDDHPMLRAGVVRCLEGTGRFDVVDEGASADCAERIARDFAPDVVILDLNMPGGGVEAAERVLRLAPRTGVIILTVEEDADRIEDAFRHGVRGYVSKAAGATELIEAVDRVASGELYLAPHLAGRMLRRLSAPPAVEVSVALGFTEREEQIMGFLIHGLSNKEIAFRLNLSEKTVKFYVTHVIRKLGVKNRVQVALYASRRGVADPAGA